VSTRTTPEYRNNASAFVDRISCGRLADFSRSAALSLEDALEIPDDVARLPA